MEKETKESKKDAPEEKAGPKALVTGGHGFIGSHLVDELIDKGYDVTVVDSHEGGECSVINVNAKANNFDVNICEIEAIDKFFVENHDFDYVFHLAAESKVSSCLQNPVKAFAVNSLGTCAVLEYSKFMNLKKFIFASTCSLYGVSNKPPHKESMPPDNLNPYAVSKMAGESLCDMYHRLFKVPTVSLRFFNVYGEGNVEEGDCAPIISKIIHQYNNDLKYTVFGDGNQTRDYVYVKDVVRAMIMAAESDNEQILGDVFNVGTGKAHSVLEIIDMVAGKAEKRFFWEPARGAESAHARADVKKIKKALGWEPSMKLEDYIKSKKTIDKPKG